MGPIFGEFLRGIESPGSDKPDGIESAGSGVLGLLDFHNNALIYGEPFDMCQGIPGFGFFDRDELYPEEERWCRAGWDAIKSLGFPRTAAADGQWRIG